MGEAIAFWDGNELVIYTKNLHPNMRGHGEAEYSDRMEMIERYMRVGDDLVVERSDVVVAVEETRSGQPGQRHGTRPASCPPPRARPGGSTSPVLLPLSFSSVVLVWR